MREKEDEMPGFPRYAAPNDAVSDFGRDDDRSIHRRVGGSNEIGIVQRIDEKQVV